MVAFEMVFCYWSFLGCGLVREEFVYFFVILSSFDISFYILRLLLLKTTTSTHKK